jgi:hypothetical protein
MTKRTYITKSGDQYEWEETPEVLEALKQLHQQQSVPSTGSDNPVV